MGEPTLLAPPLTPTPTPPQPTKTTPKKEQELPEATTATAESPVAGTPPPQPHKETPPATPTTGKKKKDKKKRDKETTAALSLIQVNQPITPVDDVVDDPAVAALRSVMSQKPAEKNPKQEVKEPKAKSKGRPTKTASANNAAAAAAANTTEQQQQEQQQPQNSDWKFVPTKKPRKLVPSSSRIARVIGRSGCNVNAIRDVTGTHIDIEKPKKGGGERTITIRGNCESTTMAYKLMEELINSDKDITELIETHFPEQKKSTGSSTDSVKGDGAKEEKAESEKQESVKPKTPSSSIEAALAAVQQSEKILSEKNERKRKKEEEEARKKKELEAKQRDELKRQAAAAAAVLASQQQQQQQQHHSSPKLATPVHKVTPVPQPVVAEKPISKAKDMDEETNRKVSEYLRSLARQDEKKRQEKSVEKQPPTVLQVNTSSTSVTQQQQDLPTSPGTQPAPQSSPMFTLSDPCVAIAPPLPPGPSTATAPPVITATIAPPTSQTVPITPTVQPGPICPPSRRPNSDLFSSPVDQQVVVLPLQVPGPPGLASAPRVVVPPPVSPR